VTRARAWAPWALLVMVVAVGLGIGASHRSAPPTLDQRVRAIASQIRCPSCADLTSAESNSVTAVGVRALIRRDLVAGESPATIEQYLAGRYGNDILLRPPARGVDALVWVLPVVAAGLAAVAVALGLRRWRPPGAPPVVDEGDRRLVEQALERAR
jgi:cytochrome c-type biogenesis protein CcmH